MSKLYADSHRQLQRRFDTERLADRIEARLFRDHVTGDDRAFIESLDMFFLATADAAGYPNCSYKGGDPGFVRVLSPKLIAFPDYDGNGMFLSLGNTLANPHVGLLFIDFENRKRLRLNGSVRLAPPDAVEPPFPGAQMVVLVDVEQVFPNCPRYIHRKTTVEPSIYVPRADVETPVPNWKRSDWACDVLPNAEKSPQKMKEP